MKVILTALLINLLSFSITKATSWQEYKDKYLRENSYVVDPYNNNRVTSESQGYGLILALKFNDKETFDNIYRWTKQNMQRGDSLFSWHWNGKVIDSNNATDGDMMIAYALLMAYKKWSEDYYMKEFESINRSLKNLIVNIKLNDSIHSLILPAKYGFSNEKYEITLYPSYYIDFIIKEFSKIDREWIPAYNFLNEIYKIKNLTTQLIYSLIRKKIETKDYADMDLYRVILYSYIAKRNLSVLRDSLMEIDNFFKANSYIPIKFKYGDKNQDKESSPYCIYKAFYLLYTDEKYLQKYNSLKEVDKQNYFCDSLELLIEDLPR